MKTCHQCKVSKPETEFAPEPRARDKLKYSCQECVRSRHRKYHAANRERRNREARERNAKHPEIGRKYAEAYRNRHPWKAMLRHSKARAIKRGVAYDLDKHAEKLKKRLEKMTCEMTGVPLVQAGQTWGRREWNAPSLDRISPKSGYTYKNVRIVCWAMNCAMSDWGQEILVDLVKRWMAKK